MDRPRGPLGRRRGERVHPGHAGAARDPGRQARDVLAVEMVFIGASNELGAFESGVVGQLLGPALRGRALGGAATVGIALLWAALFPALRATDRFPVSVN